MTHSKHFENMMEIVTLENLRQKVNYFLNG